MLDLIAARELLYGFAKSFGTNRIPLEEAHGRTLAEPIFADRDYPPFNRAAMDGYALQCSDLAAGIRNFTILETIFAGQVANTAWQTGGCFKIMTGAAVPPGADIVIRREDSSGDEKQVTISVTGWSPFQHISRQGEDVLSGLPIIQRPVLCTPAVISVLAAIGKSTVVVEALPRVALFTTGNEIAPIDQVVDNYQVRNSNRYLLGALLKKWGITPFNIKHVPDERHLLLDTFRKAMDADILIVSGAVSAGDADFVPGVLQELGVKKIFHKLAIKPGKPMWCGQMPAGGMVFALPGNPFSSLVTFVLVIEDYLHRCFNLPAPVVMSLPLNGNRRKKSSLDEFFPVEVSGSPLPAVTPVFFNSSGDILAALQADGLAWQPATTQVLEHGNVVQVFKL